MNLADDDSDYVLSKTKTLRRGIFFGTLGRITVSTAQTNALTLPLPASSTATPANTMAKLSLRFYPKDALVEPPRLGSVTTKIRAYTFFSIGAAHSLPSISRQFNHFEGYRGVYSTSVPLSSRSVESVAWTKHEPYPAMPRRDSESATSLTSSDSLGNTFIPEKTENVLYYTAQVLVPITLPSSKAWVPTFHSCLISRIYTINLSLTIYTPGTSVPASSVSLHLPVHICIGRKPGWSGPVNGSRGCC